MCPSRRPKQEFGRMIFEKNLDWGTQELEKPDKQKKTPKKGKHSLICGPE